MTVWEQNSSIVNFTLNSRIYHSDEVNATTGHHSFIVKANIEGLKCQCRFVFFFFVEH